MITSRPTEEQLEKWKRLWSEHKNKLVPGRKSGQQLLAFLEALYPLEETADPEILSAVVDGVAGNDFFSEKLPEGSPPSPKAFYIPDRGNGRLIYERRGAIFSEVERIIVGVDMVSGFYYVEGSEYLWDELCAYQGLDRADIENYVCAAQFMECYGNRGRIIGHTVTVTVDRPLGSAHPRHPDMIYPVNYGYVDGILAPDAHWQDAYILGVNEPLKTYTGRVAAVIHRVNDVEDKWVVVPDDMDISTAKIEEMTHFQERFFKVKIVKDIH